MKNKLQEHCASCGHSLTAENFSFIPMLKGGVCPYCQTFHYLPTPHANTPEAMETLATESPDVRSKIRKDWERHYLTALQNDFQNNCPKCQTPLVKEKSEGVGKIVKVIDSYVPKMATGGCSHCQTAFSLTEDGQHLEILPEGYQETKEFFRTTALLKTTLNLQHDGKCPACQKALTSELIANVAAGSLQYPQCQTTITFNPQETELIFTPPTA